MRLRSGILPLASWVALSGPGRAAADEITIATFNVRDLSVDTRTGAQLGEIAERLSPFDLVAVQEVADTLALAGLQRRLQEQGLGFSWLARPTDPDVAPHLAFLWRHGKVSLIDSGGVVVDEQDRIGHDPHYARFRAGAFDFILVNVHLPEEGPWRERSRNAGSLRNVTRFAEPRVFVEYDFILAGTFGLRPLDLAWSPLLEHYAPLLAEFKFSAAAPATVVDDEAAYDNLLFLKEQLTEFTGRWGIDRFDETLFAGDDVAAMEAISDHRPLWAVFSIDGPDDDGIPTEPVLQVSPWPEAPLATGREPVDVAAADLTGDGRVDLLSADHADATLTTLAARRPDGFLPGRKTSLAHRPSQVELADVDGDGDVDAWVRAAADSAIQIVWNEGGELAAAELYRTPGSPGAMAVGDVDADGISELAYLRAEHREIRILRKDGRTVLTLDQAVDLGPAGVTGGDLWMGDLDVDGDGDLIVVHSLPGSWPPSGYELITALQRAEAWLVRRHTVRGRNRYLVDVGDVNGDGWPDVVSAGVSRRNLSTWLAAGPGEFTEDRVHDGFGENLIIAFSTDIRSCDFDGDGLADAAVADFKGRVRVWYSDGAGGYRSLDDLPQGTRHSRLAIRCGDLDGDGDADIAGVDAGFHQGTLFYNPLHVDGGLAPVADAGVRHWVFGGDVARLDGSRSADPDGSEISFQWRQITGPPVELDDPQAAITRFAVPDVLDSAAFELTVHDGVHRSRPDSVLILMRPVRYPSSRSALREAVWERVLATPAPVSVLDVARTVPERIYCGTDGAGLLSSDDGGATWANAAASFDTSTAWDLGPTHLHIKGIAVQQSDPRVVYASTSGWIYGTTDGGDWWRRTRMYNEGGPVTVDGDRLYVGYGECFGLVRSDDGGLSWVDVNYNLPRQDVGCESAVNGIAADPFDPGILYTVTSPWGYALHRTLDGRDWRGLVWPTSTKVVETSPHTGWLYLGRKRDSRHAVYHSRRLGSVWERPRSGLHGVTEVHDFAFDPEEALTVYAATSQGVHWSVDGGMNWRPVSGGRADLEATVVAVAGGDPRRLIVGAPDGIYRVTLRRETPTGVAHQGLPHRGGNRLTGNHPNPFNSTTVLSYVADGSGPLTLTIHNLTGQRVLRRLLDPRRPGTHHWTWNGRTETGDPAASGVYICRLELAGGGERSTHRMLLVR